MNKPDQQNKTEYAKPQVKQVKFSDETVDKKSVSVTEIPMSQRGSITTLARMTPRDLKQLKAAKGEKEFFKRKVRHLWQEIAVHGMLLKDKKTGKMQLENFSDLDGETCIGLLELAKVNVKDIKYVNKGEFVSGRINFDTGKRYGFIVEEDGKTVFLDHHGPDAKAGTSGAKITYEALLSLGLLKKEPVLSKLVEFVNQVDNKSFPDAHKYFEDSYRTLLGLQRFIKFPELLQFFEDGKSPTDILGEKELIKYGFIDKDSEGKIINRALEQKKNIEVSKRNLAKLEKSGFIVSSDRYGSIVVDVGKKIPGGFDAVVAYGADTYINWSPDSNSFFLSTTREITDTLSQGIKVRETMWLKPLDDGLPLEITLDEILQKFTDGKLKPTGKLAEYLEQEAEERQKVKSAEKEPESKEVKAPTPEPVKAEPIESVAPKIPALEIKPDEKAPAGSAEKTLDNLSSKNKGFFRKMSEAGKKLANRLYDFVSDLPDVKKTVGKLEIAYNQFWVNRHEKKALGLKTKMDTVDTRLSSLNQNKAELQAISENLQQQNAPGIASMQLKIKEIDSQRIKLLNEKDLIQSKLEARSNKMKLYLNERDRVADIFINGYSDEIKPLEKKLENFSGHKDQAELLMAVTEAKYNNELYRLDSIEKNRIGMEVVLAQTGMSAREIAKSPAVKILNEIVDQGRDRVRTGQERLEQQRAELNKKLSKIGAKVNVYLDKRDQFIRIKMGRGANIEIIKRERPPVLRQLETIEAYPRAINKAPKPEAAQASSIFETDESHPLKLLALIIGWNNYLKQKFEEQDVKREGIELEVFLGKYNFNGDEKMKVENFKEILRLHYKNNNIPAEKFSQNFDKYFIEKISPFLSNEQPEQAAA